MTAELRPPPPGTAPGVPAPRVRQGPVAGLRLVWLFLAGRRIPVALAALAGCAAALRAALGWHWIPSTGSGGLQLPALIEAGAAAVIAVSTYSPFGEPERATGRWLPWLRLGTALALTVTAVGLLAAGAAGAGLAGGTLAVVRNVAGLTGIGLAAAAVTGGALAWIPPMAYLVIAEYALLNNWVSPWTWPARPPHDRGAAICAAATFVAGLVVTLARGARASSRE